MSKVELLKQIYANPELVFEHLHPNFTLHSPGNSPIAGTFYGAEGIRKHFADFERLSNGSYKHDVQAAYLADDNWGMVVSVMEGERNGVSLDMFGFGLWRFQDGLISDHWEMLSDPAQWDKFWS